jgi:hypothetical protein
LLSSKFFTFFIFLFFIGATCSAQKYLLVNTSKIKKRQYIYPGQYLTFSSVFSDKTQTRQITKLESNKVYFGEDQYKLSEIETVYITRRGFSLFSKAFTIAGIGYLGLDVINSLGDRLDGTVLRSSAILVGVGLVLKPFTSYKIEIPTEAKLNIIQVTTN